MKLEVISETLSRVTVVRMGRETAKWWNARRKAGELAVYCGWYWLRGNEEHGPFPTQSAAMRHAWYATVAQREVPSVVDSLTRLDKKHSDNIVKLHPKRERDVPLRNGIKATKTATYRGRHK